MLKAGRSRGLWACDPVTRRVPELRGAPAGVASELVVGIVWVPSLLRDARQLVEVRPFPGRPVEPEAVALDRPAHADVGVVQVVQAPVEGEPPGAQASSMLLACMLSFANVRTELTLNSLPPMRGIMLITTPPVRFSADPAAVV